MEYVDYWGALKYFEDPSRWDPGQVWTPANISAVIDHPNPANPVTFTTVIPFSGDPSRSCPSVPQSQVYNAKANPHGVRCTLQDYMINLFGRRPQDGFANRPGDDVGIQYGLKALRQGAVSPAQFVDLNSHIGGLDIDGNVSPQRTVADPVAGEAHPGQARIAGRPLHQRLRYRAALVCVRPDRGRIRDSAVRRRRTDDRRHLEVPAQAVAPRRLSGPLHRRSVGAAAEGLP